MIQVSTAILKYTITVFYVHKAPKPCTFFWVVLGWVSVFPARIKQNQRQNFNIPRVRFPRPKCLYIIWEATMNHSFPSGWHSSTHKGTPSRRHPKTGCPPAVRWTDGRGRIGRAAGRRTGNSPDCGTRRDSGRHWIWWLLFNEPEALFTFRPFSRRFYSKQLTISTFVRRKRNNISLSVQ